MVSVRTSALICGLQVGMVSHKIISFSGFFAWVDLMREKP